MPTNICSSTSTTDLYQRHITCSDSSTQTMLYDHNDDDYENYEEIHGHEDSSTFLHTNNIKKSDQSTLCRTNHYSIGCWTKPASLLTS
ncbi:unnamed protein product [Rotaria magnacalcarata]|uniref:Uncharacterized protein n=1 Tax=Rotaria magnacalcarata TaxID=392030 RepID=A0A819DJR2_9BILA|nr:unnamed protein product [Rotaria magnacalcarata]CAF1987910.1 unnamed protein product [Rotaria magnacalcarata]CAF1993013.1 unnamed protein product [Rotaria magnacalcarata]CAF2092021.1 unnamed protein product [Rotaria magnacalcarata]CAF3839505.1 unnamed protein product [Rotaria magnacalcarata]